MPAPTPEAIEKARLKVDQAKARLQDLEARAATLNRKADARRKIILGGLLLESEAVLKARAAATGDEHPQLELGITLFLDQGLDLGNRRRGDRQRRRGEQLGSGHD